MRAVFVHRTPSALGGAQTTMAAEVAALIERGWSVSLAHAEAGPIAGEPAFASLPELSLPGLFAPTAALPRALRRLDRWLADQRPDVCHVHGWLNPLLLAPLTARFPTVVTAHVPVCPNGARFHYRTERPCDHTVGMYCLTHGLREHACATTSEGDAFGGAQLALNLLLTRVSLRALSRVDRVIAPSSWQREMLIADGVSGERIVVIAPPIRRRATAPPRAAPAAPVVLAVSRLVVHKGIHRLIEACARVTADHELHIAGDGPELGRLQRLARSQGIEGRVRFRGRLAYADLDAAYGAASLVVVPSLWPETFSMVGPEALAAGTPVVAFVSGGVRDWATGDPRVTAVDTGDVAGLTSAIDAILLGDSQTDGGCRDGHACRSPDAHAQALLGVYREAIAARLRRR